MTPDLGVRHGEAHAGEEAAPAPIADVLLGLLVRLSGGGSDHVDADLTCEVREFCLGHAGQGTQNPRYDPEP